MSTRAIVEVVDSTNEKWKIYVHGDGYPEWLEVRLETFIKKAKESDPKVTGNYQTCYGNIFGTNVALEPSRFATGLIAYLFNEGNSSVYLTHRDPLKEKDTDIEYLYQVFLDGEGEITLIVTDLVRRNVQRTNGMEEKK